MRAGKSGERVRREWGESEDGVGREWGENGERVGALVSIEIFGCDFSLSPSPL